MQPIFLGNNLWLRQTQAVYFCLLQIVLWIGSPLASAYKLEPHSSQYTATISPNAETGQKEVKLSIFVIEPMDVHQMVETLHSPNGRRITDSILLDLKMKYAWQYRIEAQFLIEVAILNIRKAYLRKSKAGSLEIAALEARLEGLRSGHYPIILITEYNNPINVLQTISIGYDFGDGLPSEIQTQVYGMQSFPPVVPRPEFTSVKYFPKFGRFEEEIEMSAFLKKRKFITGGRNEIRFFSRPNSSPWGLAPLIQRLLLSHQFTLWSRTLVGKEGKLPPYSARQYEEAQKLLKSKPRLLFNPALVYPEQQRWVVNDDLYIWVLGDFLMSYYVSDLAYDEPVQSFEIAPDKVVYVSKIPRVKYENETSDRLSRIKGGLLVDNTTLTLNIINKRLSDMVSGYCGGLIIGDRPFNFELPLGSYLNPATLTY